MTGSFTLCPKLLTKAKITNATLCRTEGAFKPAVRHFSTGFPSSATDLHSARCPTFASSLRTEYNCVICSLPTLGNQPRCLPMRRFAILAICAFAQPGGGSPPQQARPVTAAREKAQRAAARPASSPDVCGNLLQQYATEPPGVVFTGCAKGQGQTVAVASYRVAGAESARVEKFFREKYGMGKLVFVCCGWEPENGRTGQSASAALKRLNPDYSLTITMFATDATLMASGTRALTDKRRVKHFTVEVRVEEV